MIRTILPALVVLFAVSLPIIIVRLYRRTPDTIVDGLIEKNKFKPRPGMERVDWKVMEKIGSRNRDQVMQAEKRIGLN